MLPDEYGCVVVNRFGQLFLDDGAEPSDLINEPVVEKKKKKKQEQNKPKKPGQRESQKDRWVQGDAGDAPAGQKQPARGGPVQNEEGRGAVEAERPTKRPVFGERRTNQEQRPQEFSVQRPPYDADSEARVHGGRRGRGGGRGGSFRNPENFNLRGKREYERQSGTGVSPEEKRGGRGPWNWGSVQDSMGREVVETTPEAPAQPEEPQQPVEGQGENQASEAEVVVQVAMEMSLDEWKAMQEQSRPKAEFNLRKADGSVPNKATVIHKSKFLESQKAELMEEAEDSCHYLRRPANDITTRLDINFGSLQRSGRRGRGRGRGGPTSCPEREAAALAPDPYDPYDPEDFPALG